MEHQYEMGGWGSERFNTECILGGGNCPKIAVYRCNLQLKPPYERPALFA